MDLETTIAEIITAPNDFKVDPNALYIGHNIITYDLPALSRLWNINIPHGHVLDTLVCSRLFNYSASNGHSLGAWGDRLKFPKMEFNEWQELPDADKERDRLNRLYIYCTNDCYLNRLVFLKLEKVIYGDRWKQSLRTEHEIAFICEEIKSNGFNFDIRRGKSIAEQLSRSVSELSRDLDLAFLPKKIPWPSRKEPDRYYLEPFNPASPKQVVEILNEARWKPFEKTDGHKDCEKELQKSFNTPKATRDNARVGELTEKLANYKTYGWKVSEENLETLPEDAPEGCKLLVKWRMLSKRLQTLDEWFRSYNERSGRIHGNYNHIGTWTHRMSHSDPNQGNVPSVDSKYHSPELKELAYAYGKDMRSCFVVGDDCYLVGVDADSIQLRILAHYMDDPKFTEALVKGKKEDGTDPHSLNTIPLELPLKERNRSKTFIYAWILGAGLAKVAKILGCTIAEAAIRVDRFIKFYPGLQKLKAETIPSDAARGYFVGLDGRIIRSDEYHMIAGYLQAGEAVIMKSACVDWNRRLKRERIAYKLVNFVHDEWQTEVRGNREVSEYVARSQIEAIRLAGSRVQLKCPLDGTAKIGTDWYETH